MSEVCRIPGCDNKVEPMYKLDSHKEYGVILCRECLNRVRVAGSLDTKVLEVGWGVLLPETPEEQTPKNNQELVETVEAEQVYETVFPEELTQEQKLKVADLVNDEGYDKVTAKNIVLGKEMVAVESEPHQPEKHITRGYTPEQVNTIRNTVAKGASDDELAMFMHISQTYGLDPFMKEIFYSAQMKTIMTSRDGYLKIAQRDPNFDGLQSMAVCENDDFSIDMQTNSVNHTFGKGDRGKVIGAWAICYHKQRKPVIAYADYSEYNKGNNIWNTYRSAMSCKVAEAFSLKRQFGISGLVTVEEME